MSKWLMLGCGILLLVALAVAARFYADSHDSAPSQDQPPAEHAVNELRSEDGRAGADAYEPQTDTAAVSSAIVGKPDAGPLDPGPQNVGILDPGAARTREDGVDIDNYEMPTLEQLRSSTINSGPGPSHVKLELPGPSRMVESAANAANIAPASGQLNDQITVEAIDDGLGHGPSQVNIGFPGPGEGVDETQRVEQPADELVDEGEMLPDQ